MLDLFSGIGGFSLGLENTGGFETAAFCEIEPFPRKVLAKHWPDKEIFNDVRQIPKLGGIDVVCGGYPCQPFSTAGKRRGAEDDRHLWPAMLAVIQRERPAWVIGENVAGHVSMGLDEVLSDLEGEGYTARPFIIPACATDAQHRRDRVWIVANANSQGLQGRAQTGDPCQERSGGNQQPERCAHRQPRIWPTESGVGRVLNGVPKRVDRLKGLGNAVVPAVVERIGYAILEAEGLL
ncbi:MAG: DNA (cytosine-5-)-methyltransferase [Lentilitoribacter sp.]|uniref:DNA cytosine methyltransferase n=1 Tax=Parasphingorhabdus sp. TaxID=2709688 RepID=UPI00328D5A08